MLTSSNQYLRPEYLTPLPTTLDAKKSPLALLAQTCSQIGVDSPNAKLLSAADKKTKDSSSSSTSSSSSSSSTTPTTVKERQKTVAESPNRTTTSFKPYEHHVREKSKTPESRSTGSRVRTPISKPPVAPSVRCASNQSAASERKSPSSDERDATPNQPERGSPPNINKPNTSEVTAFKATGVHHLPPYLPGYPPQYDIMTHLKASGLHPYLNYARMKTSPVDALCRDPFCGGCNLKTAASSCPAGCTQCDHVTSKASSYAAAAYAHAQLAALAAASHLPYVCNWISGDAAYCGKRFGNSEELLSHLRTHTNTSEASALSMHPLLHRSYPTPPLSPRYHPYSKPPTSLLPPAISTSPLSSYPLTHPALSPYLSPYSIYGPRLGAAPGMHP